MSTVHDDDLGALLREHVSGVSPRGGALELVEAGRVRRRRLRRGAAAGMTLAVALVAVPAVGSVLESVDRTDRVTVQPAVPAAPATATAPPAWPFVSAGEVQQWSDDPEVLPGMVPSGADLTTPQGTVRALLAGAMSTDPAEVELAVASAGPTRATVVLRRAGQTLTVVLERSSTDGPWLVTGSSGSTVTVDSPASGTTVASGALLTGVAPAGAQRVFVQMVWPGGGAGYSVDVVDGAWAAELLTGAEQEGVDEQLTSAGVRVPAGPVGVLVTPNDGLPALGLGVVALTVTD